MTRPALEPFARLAMQKMGRNPDDWRAMWNPCREFLAMMEAYEELMSAGMVERKEGE